MQSHSNGGITTTADDADRSPNAMSVVGGVSGESRNVLKESGRYIIGAGKYMIPRVGCVWVHYACVCVCVCVCEHHLIL